MNPLTLVIANLARKPTRTVLTFASLVIAFLLFMLLRAIAGAFSGGVAAQGVQRVFVDAKYSMTDNLPMTHVNAMAELPGVVAVTPMNWFGGYYQEPSNAFAKIAVDQQRFFDVYPEIVVSEPARQRFLASRRAVIAAAPIATQFGWQVGDPIPIRGDIWPKEDGSWDWEFVYAGAYATPPGSRVQPMFLIRSDYFMESVIDWAKHQATSAVLRVHEDADPQAVIDAIDLAFENSSDPTKSLSEDDYTRQFANQLGDIGLITTLILVAVFFTLLLLTANVVSLGFQERVPELAVLKTLGFQDRFVAGLVLGEALLLCMAGAAVGVAAGFALEPWLNANLGGVLGRFDMAWRDAGAAVTIAAVMGLMVGLPAAAAAQRLSIVRALQVAR